MTAEDTNRLEDPQEQSILEQEESAGAVAAEAASEEIAGEDVVAFDEAAIEEAAANDAAVDVADDEFADVDVAIEEAVNAEDYAIDEAAGDEDTGDWFTDVAAGDEPAGDEDAAIDEAAGEDAVGDDVATSESADVVTDEAADDAANDEAADDTASGEDEPKQGALSKLSAGVWIAIAAVALVAGLFIGATFIGGGAGALGKSTVTEAELDTPIATYVYNGTSHDLSIRDAITVSAPLESAKDANGNYAVPNVDSVLNLARNAVVMDEATSRNISASEEEIAEFATQNIGSSDYATMAQQYGLEESELKEMLARSCTMNKLQQAVVEEVAGKAPEAPEAPKDVKKDGDKTSKKYAEYIIKLVGSEWNAEKGTWASEDSTYAQLLKDYKIKADSASYNAAKAAYDAASQAYSTRANNEWGTFINNLLSNASIQVRTLLA